MYFVLDQEHFLLFDLSPDLTPEEEKIIKIGVGVGVAILIVLVVIILVLVCIWKWCHGKSLCMQL